MAPRKQQPKSKKDLGIPVEREFDPGPPPAEQSNRESPAVPGEHVAIPGAGVVDRDTHAPGVTEKQQVERPVSSAAGARRPGTTRSGPALVPSGTGVGANAGPLDNEAITSLSSDAPLSVPTGGTGAPRPGAARGAPEADAASAGPLAEKGQQREKQTRRKLKNPNAHQDSD